MADGSAAGTDPFGRRILRDFDTVDANQDSFISPGELEAAMSERQARRRERSLREPAVAPESSPTN